MRGAQSGPAAGERELLKSAADELARSDEAVAQANMLLEGMKPREIVAWTWETFGPSVAASSSFQSQSAALLHMIAAVSPKIEVLFLDTGFHFPETLAYRRQLQELLGLRVVDLYRSGEPSGAAGGGGPLYQRDPDLCCYIHKVEPLERALRGVEAWITGVRRDQTRKRRSTPVLSRRRRGGFRVCPMAGWSRREVEAYGQRHRLPLHPLTELGYPSIGCSPCTRPAGPGDDERAGRWAGTEKTECGLHLRDDDEGAV